MAIQDREIRVPAPVPPEHAAPLPPVVHRLPVPFVSYALMGLSVVVFVLKDFLTTEVFGVRASLGLLYGPLISAGQWWRACTTWVTHANVLHLVLNMSVVYSLGVPLERGLGSIRFAWVSLISGLGSSAAVVWLAYNQPTVGASGMILGWAGVMLPAVSGQARRSLGIWLVQIALLSFLPMVSWQGHLGGFLWGLLCGLTLRFWRRAFWFVAPGLLLASAAALFVGARLNA